MGDYCVIASFLDAIAQEATQHDLVHGSALWLETESDLLKRQWEILQKRVELEEKLMAIAYNLAHYGEVYFYNAVNQANDAKGGHDDGNGIDWWLYDEPENVTVILGERREPLGYKSEDIVPEASADGLMKLWEFTHFRMITKSLLIATGDSLLLPVRKIWRMLKMMEDSLVIYRLIKGPDRFVYYYDIGQQRSEDGQKTGEAWKQSLRRRSYVNPQTGQFDERWLGISVEEDIYWPVRAGSQSRVERLSGATNLPHIEDIEYLRDQLYGGLHMPKAFFAQEGEVAVRGRALAMLDIWFARTVKRAQKGVTAGARRAFDIHLAAQQVDPRLKENAYKLNMHAASNLEELQELEGLMAKFDAGDRLYEFGSKVGVENKKWLNIISKDVLHLPKELCDILNQVPLTPDMDIANPDSPAIQHVNGFAKELMHDDDTMGKLGLLLEGVEQELVNRGELTDNLPLPDKDWRRSKIAVRDLSELEQRREQQRRARWLRDFDLATGIGPLNE